MSSIVQEHTLAELTQERRATSLGLLWGGVLPEQDGGEGTPLDEPA